MIAKASWFKIRKFGGWGVSPKTWQGWAYVGLMVAILFIIQVMFTWDAQLQLYITIGWVGFILLDLIPVMVMMNKDEREQKNEAKAERNAAWAMVGILVVGLLYETISSAINNDFKVNLFIIGALLGGALIKTITNLYLDHKGE